MFNSVGLEFLRWDEFCRNILSWVFKVLLSGNGIDSGFGGGFGLVNFKIEEVNRCK